ncbi:MAG TPA: 5'-nucleotidase, lipoprotein e(P4) family [Bacteroidales bacterium]|nr:5'-nucleotidase, lipoprotein e(P4) family [Bacteroidales bacterium]
MKSIAKLFIVLAFAGLASACNHSHQHEHKGMHPALYATLYQQQAAEYRALCYQAFNLAEIQLEAVLRQSTSKPLAIITDIDETVLDNSPYQAAAILGGFGYPVRWADWMQSADAWAIPGALEFLNKVSAAGITIFYVSNRKEEFRAPTLRNLEKLGFPNASDQYLLLRQEGEGNEKETRRKKIDESFEVVMLLGDNLDDFSEVFEVNDAGERMLQADLNKNAFGRRFIVLPNASYGSWVNVLPGYDRNLSTEALSDSLLRGLMPF